MKDPQTKVKAKSLDKPDEVHKFLKGKVELTTISGVFTGRATFGP